MPTYLSAEGCSQAEADRLTAFFTPRIDQLPGTARGLVQTRESIMLCAALQTSRNSAAIAD